MAYYLEEMSSYEEEKIKYEGDLAKWDLKINQYMEDLKIYKKYLKEELNKVETNIEDTSK